MARTITFGKLISALQHQIPRMKEEIFAADYCGQLINKIWDFADWRESLAELPPFYVVGDRQDYGAPIYAIPSDFQGLRMATLVQLVDGDNSVVFNKTPMATKTRQQGAIRYGTPDVLSYEPSSSTFKVFPILPANVPTNQFMVEGVYKTLPRTNLLDTYKGVGIPLLASQINRENYTKALLPLDDRHYNTMEAVMSTIARSPANANERLANDQYIHMLLEEAAIKEGFEIGSGTFSPDEPLSSYRG